MMPAITLWAALLACGFGSATPIDQDCARREAWYPDTDGDLYGDGEVVYIGCYPPEGWVLNPPLPSDTDDTATDSQ